MRVFFLLFITLLACDDHDERQAMTGQWDMTFVAFGQNRHGALLLRDNHTGYLVMEADSSSTLLPEADQFDLQWQVTNNSLNIERLDNNFVLSYDVVSSSTNSISLKFTDEIYIRLSR